MPLSLSLSLSQVNELDSSELHTFKSQRIEVEETKDTYLERDPEICHQIRTYTVNQRDDLKGVHQNEIVLA